jgi:hypothetical protein
MVIALVSLKHCELTDCRLQRTATRPGRQRTWWVIAASESRRLTRFCAGCELGGAAHQPRYANDTRARSASHQIPVFHLPDALHLVELLPDEGDGMCMRAFFVFALQPSLKLICCASRVVCAVGLADSDLDSNVGGEAPAAVAPAQPRTPSGASSSAGAAGSAAGSAVAAGDGSAGAAASADADRTSSSAAEPRSPSAAAAVSALGELAAALHAVDSESGGGGAGADGGSSSAARAGSPTGSARNGLESKENSQDPEYALCSHLADLLC